MLPYVKQLTRVLSEQFGWNRARLKVMARLMRALPIQTTTNLAELALVMKPQVETESTYRRLQRFFAGFAFGYEALGQFLLGLVPTDPPYVAVVDRTEWHFWPNGGERPDDWSRPQWDCLSGRVDSLRPRGRIWSRRAC
jgi:hypothetical protein